MINEIKKVFALYLLSLSIYICMYVYVCMHVYKYMYK